LRKVEEDDCDCDDHVSGEMGTQCKTAAGAGGPAARTLRASKSSSIMLPDMRRAIARKSVSEASPSDVLRTKRRASLAGRHREGPKSETDFKNDTTPELDGLTMSAVRRASMPVASILKWIVAQVRLANALPSGDMFLATSDENACIAEADAASTRVESACETLQSMQELIALHDASSGTLAPSDARRLLARAAQPGSDGAEAKRELNIALSTMAMLKGRLGELRQQKFTAVQALETKVDQLKEQNFSLESKLHEAEAAQERKREADLLAQGPALCDCEPPEEMIIRQVTALNSEDFARWYWVCAKPVRRRCGRKFFDDSVARNALDLLERLKGGL